jgi:hypothetical protein
MSADHEWLAGAGPNETKDSIEHFRLSWTYSMAILLNPPPTPTITPIPIDTDTPAPTELPTETPTPVLGDDAPNTCEAITQTSPSNVNLRYLLETGEDEDWFRFTLETTNTVQAHLESLPADYDLFVYDMAGQELGGSNQEGKAAELVILTDAAPGDYCVLVVGKTGDDWDADNPYQLRFNVPGTGGP